MPACFLICVRYNIRDFSTSKIEQRKIDDTAFGQIVRDPRDGRKGIRIILRQREGLGQRSGIEVFVLTSYIQSSSMSSRCDESVDGTRDNIADDCLRDLGGRFGDPQCIVPLELVRAVQSRARSHEIERFTVER